MTWAFASAPEGIRTPNLLIRSQMLYPLSYGRTARLATSLGHFSVQPGRARNRPTWPWAHPGQDPLASGLLSRKDDRSPTSAPRRPPQCTRDTSAFSRNVEAAMSNAVAGTIGPPCAVVEKDVNGICASPLGAAIHQHWKGFPGR